MDYKFKNGKYILCKEGVYFALCQDEIPEMIALLMEIQTHYLRGNQETNNSEQPHFDHNEIMEYADKMNLKKDFEL